MRHRLSPYLAPADDSGHTRLPGEGPSADRLGHPHPPEPNAQGGGGGGAIADRPVLNQDGSQLGSINVDGAGARHPEGPVGAHRHGDHFDPATSGDLPIGGPTGVFKEQGTDREIHDAAAGGAAPQDFGTPGWIGGDPSNIGLPDSQIDNVMGPTDVDDPHMEGDDDGAVRYDR